MIEELIIRSLQGHASGMEEEHLRRWKSSSARNARRYQEFEAIWSLTGVAVPFDGVCRRWDAAEIIATAATCEKGPAGHGKISPPPGRSGPGAVWPRGRAVWLAASIAIVGLSLAILADRWTASARPVAYSEIVTGDGELATFTLTDGTAIRVGPQSRLTVTEKRGQTTVQLEGRAFFGVIPDRSRLFTVQTKFGEATALGTRFEIRSDEQEFRVLVVEGSVRVSSAGTSLELSGGLMGESREGGPLSTAQVEQMEPLLRWMGSTLMFRDTPLRRALAEVEDRYGISLYLEDPALGDLAVTATFTDQRVETVVSVLCEMVSASCAIEDGGSIRLRPQQVPSPRSAEPDRARLQ